MIGNKIQINFQYSLHPKKIKKKNKKKKVKKKIK